MSTEAYREGERLTREGLFMIVAEEAFKDGVLDPTENEILGQLARGLKLDEKTARTLARQALQRFREGQLGTARPMDPELLYERVLYFSVADGGLDERELAMLKGLGKLLKLPFGKHPELLERVQSPGYAMRSGVADHPPTIPVMPARPRATGTTSALELPPAGEGLTASQGRGMALRQAALSGRVDPETMDDLDDASGVPETASAPERAPAPVIARRAAAPVETPAVAPAAAATARPKLLPGQKAGSASFGLRPGGLPLPHRQHAVAVGAAILVAFLGFSLGSGAVSGSGERGGKTLTKVVVMALVAAYWGVRTLLEKQLFVPGSTIDVDAHRIRLPGFLVGMSGHLEIKRDEILHLRVAFQKGQPHALHMKTSRFAHTLVFYATAVDGDLSAIGRALQQYMIKPCDEGEAGDEPVPPAVMAGIALFLSGIALYIFGSVKGWF